MQGSHAGAGLELFLVAEHRVREYQPARSADDNPQVFARGGRAAYDDAVVASANGARSLDRHENSLPWEQTHFGKGYEMSAPAAMEPASRRTLWKSPFHVNLIPERSLDRNACPI